MPTLRLPPLPVRPDASGDAPPGVAQRPCPRRGKAGLDPLFRPRSVAVIGATESPGSAGLSLMRNLLATPFGGPVHPVNPAHDRVLGIAAHPTIGDVPGPVDLAVIVTPAATVPALVRQCGAAGVRAVVVLSAGFGEASPAGAELAAQVVAELDVSRTRLVGPNCLGVLCPTSGLNASFGPALPRRGHLAVVSQSGAVLSAMLDWAAGSGVGFSSLVSCGAMLDVAWGDLIGHLGDDPNTRAILLYMESVGDARAFMASARLVGMDKPVVVLKPGRTAAAAHAALSHTGALAGADDVLDAALDRAGVLRASTLAELFDLATLLARHPAPAGPRLTVVTNAGGPGVLAADALADAGGEMSPLADATCARLDAALPAAWSHGNPIDVLGDAGPDRYAAAVRAALADPATDGLLVVLTPQATTDPSAIAERVVAEVQACGSPAKPVLASWMGGGAVAAGRARLVAGDVPTFDDSERAARAFGQLWHYRQNVTSPYASPGDAMTDDGVDPAAAAGVIAAVRAAGRSLLTETESKRLLAAYGIPTVPCTLARTADAAAGAARAIGYPVVLKLNSTRIAHKTDVGGVALNLTDDAAVRAAFDRIRRSVVTRAGDPAFEVVSVEPMVRYPAAGHELIVGSSADPQFGPVFLFGAGGLLVQVLADRALALPPLSEKLPRRMMERTRIYAALRGVRGRRPVDLAVLERVLVRLARLVVEQPWVKEVDVNPLLASPDGVVALDARVALHGAATPPQSLPRPAIRPYPAEYVGSWTADDGTAVAVRPIRPADEPMMGDFHRRLGDEAVRRRYFASLPFATRADHGRLARSCLDDYDRGLALVAEAADAEAAVVVRDAAQGQGVGTDLLRRLIRVARAEGITRLYGDVEPDNLPMRQICRTLDVALTPSEDRTNFRAELWLDPS